MNRPSARLELICAVLLAGLTASAVHPTAIAAQRRVLTIDDQFLIERVGSPRISPSGERVAYTVSTTDYDTNSSETRIWIVDRDGGEPIPMTRKGSSASSPPALTRRSTNAIPWPTSGCWVTRCRD